ncbi:DUF5344 family protein [Enterococcus wangshanyuanii]|uniref:ESAT-6-like protein n=1 Tax=Enterococcus wangshanyuanii TaxID=2005703 RepID=A0ABQ1PF57_9ENTE|nr:DUF5344 family protein [Enterococcus wangshanyuanii]GGC96062.1 hypothetical protein GCM10011573_27130 [Enterococcus wangshanyuanii]
MGKINVNYGQARSEISNIENQIHSCLNSAKSQMSQLSSLLNESEGAFVTEIRQQFKAEEQIITASEGFFREMCQALLSAVDTYEEQDRNIANSMDKAIS